MVLVGYSRVCQYEERSLILAVAFFPHRSLTFNVILFLWQASSSTSNLRVELPLKVNVCWHLIAIIYTDPKLVDQLLSPSLLRFLKTGADHYALSFDDDLDNVLFIILYI